MFSIGDYVTRKSYNRDILFRITYITPNQIARLKGVSYRVIADAPISDLVSASDMRYTIKEDSIMALVEKNVNDILAKRAADGKTHQTEIRKIGSVLHLDSDAYYLNLCLKYYNKLGIPAVGEHVAEADQPKRVQALIQKYSPDILVLTGHDALNKNYKSIYDAGEYRNSEHFIDAVKKAREIRPSSNELVIYAGACQSYFEGLLDAGADFAASPARVLIHALDPVFIVEKIATCEFYQVLTVPDALQYTITQFKGLGGYEILGKSKYGAPVTVVSQEDVQRTRSEGSTKISKTCLLYTSPSPRD